MVNTELQAQIILRQDLSAPLKSDIIRQLTEALAFVGGPFHQKSTSLSSLTATRMSQ
jgi:hypothetical protein